MGAHIGKDNELLILKSVRESILLDICQYNYETGGIIGADEEGKIIAFQFDQIKSPALYEYYPNTSFLNHILHNDWEKRHINFVGFIHSHLHNNQLSKDDISYARKILQQNKSLPCIFMGVIDLSQKIPDIKWYRVEMRSVSSNQIRVIF